jgi:altronate dehydratase small subunit
VVGTTLTLCAIEAIPFGFKIALQEIPQGQIIRKYGETIGMASRPIAKGALVHIHNLEGTRARGDLAKKEDA